MIAVKHWSLKYHSTIINNYVQQLKLSTIAHNAFCYVTLD